MAIVEVKLRQDPREALGVGEILAPTVFLRSPTRYSRFGKRLVDVIGASLALVILLPVLLAVAALVRINLGAGGIIYRQNRVGRNGTPFVMYKFRSMLPDRRINSQRFVGVDRRRAHKTDHDPRHTPFGRFLRRHSLDELPQLVNVLRGDMSLVGPRPEMLEVAWRDGFVDHPRHRERPGMTGAFQVSPLRSTNRLVAGLHLDMAYVADVRLRKDLAIIARTVRVVTGRNN